jgi:hypothetical protein
MNSVCGVIRNLDAGCVVGFVLKRIGALLIQSFSGKVCPAGLKVVDFPYTIVKYLGHGAILQPVQNHVDFISSIQHAVFCAA